MVGRPPTTCYFIVPVYDIWSMVFCLFGVQWVMPRRVVELLERGLWKTLCC